MKVSREGLWEAVEAVVPAGAFEAELSPTRRIVTPQFESAVGALQQAGVRVLIRYARRSAEQVEAARADLAVVVDKLPVRARTVLWRAIAHARDGEVLGSHCWDPLEEAGEVRVLHGSGLIRSIPDRSEPFHGRYQLHEDLPSPPPRSYDFEEAAMERTDDLSEPMASPIGLLHDLAALGAGIAKTTPKRTLKGHLEMAGLKRLGKQLGASLYPNLDERWARALRALELLGVVRTEPIRRTLHLEPSLEGLLAGSTSDAIERLVARLVDQDLQAVLPAVRAALRHAGEGAIDEMIFLELLAEQHRDIIFAPWRRDGRFVYPEPAGDRVAWSDEAFELIEARMIRELLRVLVRLGLIVRASGVFAPTEDGQIWASGDDPPSPPVWLGSDLHALVPPHAITPWERFQLERFGRCIARDVVDRYALEREGLETWLSTHELDQALGLLERRCPSVPPSVRETLQEWHRAATAVVLTRGVILDDGQDTARRAESG